VSVAFVIGVAACGGADATGPGGTPVAAVQASSGGDAARIICEAECRRSARCLGADDSAACFTRCPTLPVRNPPVWQADWASAFARCADQPTCGRDEDERCLFMFMIQQPPNEAVQACLSSNPPDQRDVRTKGGRRCLILSGLTPGASAQAAACLRSGAEGKSCVPPFDWK
jgi:hypothetical protein